MDEIRTSLKRGIQSQVAKELNVSTATVNNILRGRAKYNSFNVRVAKRLLYLAAEGDELKFIRLKKEYLNQ